MKVKDILDRVTLLYHDLDYRRVTRQMYLMFLDDAILETINVRPDAHEKRSVIQLVPGPRQRVPADGYTLIDVYANKNWIKELNRYTDGKPVYQVARKDLDYFYNWYTTKVGDSPTIDEFAFDVRTPKDFWVNPPVGINFDVYVEIGYSYAHPAFGEIDTETQSWPSILDMEIDMSSEFRNALVLYMMYKLFSTDTTADSDIQRATMYLTQFNNALKQNFSSEVLANSRIIEPTTEGLGLHNDTPVNTQTVMA